MSGLPRDAEEQAVATQQVLAEDLLHSSVSASSGRGGALADGVIAAPRAATGARIDVVLMASLKP